MGEPPLLDTEAFRELTCGKQELEASLLERFRITHQETIEVRPINWTVN